MDPEISKIYGHRIRIRVCGLCWDGDKLLMVNHKRLNSSNFWAPPGGGLDFGETIEMGLKREFLEETGLEITPLKFAFGCEFLKNPLHSIELFFNVKQTGGAIAIGYDPEIQVIQDVKFKSEQEIHDIPAQELHGIFQLTTYQKKFKELSGFYSI